MPDAEYTFKHQLRTCSQGSGTGKVPPRFCAECGHEVVETLVEKETGKGLDAAAIWSAGLSAFSASGLSSADSDYVWQKIEPAAKTSGYPQPA